MITVYSRPDCYGCKATHRALSKKNIPYTSIDVSQDPGAHDYVKSLGYTSLPVVVTDNEHWSGYRPDRITSII